jgi:hypothetical protein
MDYDENRYKDDIKKRLISIENELTQSGVFDDKKTRTYEDLEKERILLLKLIQLQSQYITVLRHKLKGK